MSALASPSKMYAVELDGAKAHIDFEGVIGRNRELLDATLRTEQQSLDAMVAWGHWLLQIRPQFPHGRWERFKAAHLSPYVKRAEKAVRLAEEAAAADGTVDVAKVDAAVKLHNATAAERGVRPLRDGVQSVRSTQIAFGLRPGDPAKPKGQPANSPARDNLHGRPTSDFDEVAAMAAEALGVKTAAPVKAVHAAAVERVSGAQPPVKVAASETRGTQSQPSRKGNDVHGQLLLDDLFREVDGGMPSIATAVKNRSPLLNTEELEFLARISRKLRDEGRD